MELEFEAIAIALGMSGKRPQTVVHGAYLRALRKLRWPPDKRHGRDFLGDSAANIEWRLKHNCALIAKCK